MVSKISVMAEDIRRAGEMMQESLDWGRSVPQAAKELTTYLGEDSAVYIVDNYENEVAATGDSTPNFDYVVRISMGEEYMFVGDSKVRRRKVYGLRKMYAGNPETGYSVCSNIWRRYDSNSDDTGLRADDQHDPRGSDTAQNDPADLSGCGREQEKRAEAAQRD